MGAIDIHTHAFPDSLAKRAIPQLQSAAQWRAVGDDAIRGLLESMDQADIDMSVVCAIATKPVQVKDIFKWCRKIADERIIPLPSVHPQTKDAAGWVRKFADEGFAGIKLHPLYQGFAADDEQASPIFEAAAECELVVAIQGLRDVAYPPTLQPLGISPVN